MNHTQWLDKSARSTFRSPVDMQGILQVGIAPRPRDQTNRELQPVTHFLAWQLAMRLASGDGTATLFTTSGTAVQVPPPTGETRFYDPHRDSALLGFLSHARMAARGIPPSPYADTKWALESLVDPRTAHAAWPTQQEIIELELDQIEWVLDELYTGKNPHRLGLALVAKYQIGPLFARQVVEQLIVSLEEGDQESKDRRRTLAGAVLDKARENADERGDDRALIAAQGQQAKLHGIQQAPKMDMMLGDGAILMQTILSTANEISDRVIDVTPERIMDEPATPLLKTKTKNDD